ncbi:MAG: tRNA (guanosine(37)-N1)-methyltransferase TrmD [Proteobacteria bacterium]|nr:MAG: tRNA (guanosine(37)-N1)-methyltransferase TrmD [Pseudomonadota bacterium]
MEFDVLTLFPQIFTNVMQESIMGRAVEKGLVKVNLVQIRDFAKDKHRTTDDLPYGGGPGMVMKYEPLFAAWESAVNRNPELKARTVLMSPGGRPLRQALLEEWGRTLPGKERLILVCGRYEGIDERFVEECVDEQVSLGDFVLSGGEIPAMALIDGLMRLIPGALGNADSSAGESFSTVAEGLLEFPQYTRPPEYRGRKVPDILLSGDHAKIARWRKEQSRSRTEARRPELLKPTYKSRKP